MKSELESKLKRIEDHAEVARGGIYPSVYAVHNAQADLRNNDVPYLLDVVRKLAAQNEVQKKSLQTIENVVNRWDNEELAGTDEIRQALKEASNE